MELGENDNLKPVRLPAVTREVLDRLDSKGYNGSQAARFMEESDPIASDVLNTFINSVAETNFEKVVAYETAVYLYTLLSEAQSTEQSS